MNALELVHTITSQGGELWGEGGKLRYRAPQQIIGPLLSELKQHKAEILEFLRTSKKGKRAPKSKVSVYRVVVNGKAMTVIDPHREPQEQFIQGIKHRFCHHEIESIERC